MPSTINPLVVILHYGGSQQTTVLHEQLERYNAGHHQVRVLDNASPEPYAQAWVRTKENLYWAGALELALRLGRQEGFSHLWFLNNDIYFLFAKDIVGYAKHRLQEIEARLGPVAIYSPGVRANPYHPQMQARAGGNFRQVAYIDGIAPLISLNYSQQAGLDRGDNPYGYGVDVWFSLQAVKYGWKLVVDHTLVMRHRYHSTAKTIPGFLSAAAKMEHLFLQSRLGPQYQRRLQNLSQNFQEY